VGSFSFSNLVPTSLSAAALDPADRGRQRVTYQEFLTYLFDREQTKELAVELAFVIDEHLIAQREMQPA
jgi:hypothetical protein